MSLDRRVHGEFMCLLWLVRDGSAHNRELGVMSHLIIDFNNNNNMKKYIYILFFTCHPIYLYFCIFSLLLYFCYINILY